MKNLITQYRSMVARGDIEQDPAQEALTVQLDALERELRQRRLARNSSVLGRLFGRAPVEPVRIRGVYVHGEVGRGKTMLMDLFFAHTAAARKRRAHFNEFMNDVHERIHAYRQQLKRGEVKGDDPIPPVAASLAQEASLLCFDEFQVTDIADAMLLGRLFARLFDLGVVVVATSNVPPHDLYRNGLNRALFLPFIALLKEHMHVVELHARTDFRLEKFGRLPVWHTPADAHAHSALESAWKTLTGGERGERQEIRVKGRIVPVPKAAMGAAWFTFGDLCGQPLGAADYLRIARDFHTLFVERIPVMGEEQRNEARRFVALIDTLYDNGVKLIASAAAEPNTLYTAAHGNEAHEFKRTASRLAEMRTQSYLALPHGRREARDDALGEIVET